MRTAEDQGLQRNARHHAPSPGTELPLQIAAKHNLLAKPRAASQHHEHGHFHWVPRQEKLSRLFAAKMQRIRQCPEHNQDYTPESKRYAEIDKEVHTAAPSSSDNLRDLHSTPPQSKKPHIPYQHPLIDDRCNVYARQVRKLGLRRPKLRLVLQQRQRHKERHE